MKFNERIREVREDRDYLQNLCFCRFVEISTIYVNRLRRSPAIHGAPKKRGARTKS